MKELQVFNNEEFGQVRVIEKDSQPWFVAVDVCRALDIANARDALTRLDADEKGVASTDTLGGAQGMNIINEAGLYALVLGSRKPEARAFKRWITHEVIPAIRKHGGYLTPEKVEEVLLNPDTIIALATQLKTEREQRKALEEKVQADEPYTNFGMAVANSSDAITIREFAKLMANDGLSIGQNRLYRWLRDNGLLMSTNAPYQRYVDQGIFRVRESVIHAVNGDILRTTTLITGKGQMYLADKLKRDYVMMGA